LEGAAAEVLRDFDDTSPTAVDDLWERLSHRFGDVDECSEVMRKFEAHRQFVEGCLADGIIGDA